MHEAPSLVLAVYVSQYRPSASMRFGSRQLQIPSSRHAAHALPLHGESGFVSHRFQVLLDVFGAMRIHRIEGVAGQKSRLQHELGEQGPDGLCIGITKSETGE